MRRESTEPSPPGIPLRLTMREGLINEFFPILQQGFGVSARVGCSLRKLLCEQFALGDDYVTERITTIFLNGKATDDLDDTIVRDGSTVALSGAMPGLVGATMRRGGYYAAMRGSITHVDDLKNGEERIGTVRVKLFNILLADLGPGFLQRGIVIPATEMAVFLAGRSGEFWQGCTEMVLNGRQVEPGRMPVDGGPFMGDGTVRLTADFRGER